MKLRKTIVAVLSVTLTLLMASAVIAPAVHNSGLPKVDNIYYKAYPGAAPDVIVNEFLACETDWIGGPGRSDLYQDVVDAGHKISTMNNMSEFTFFPINCRDYKETSGDPNAPLNDSSFRLALSYVYGMDDKEADVSGYYGVPWYSALGNPVPPAQEPWYDAATQMPPSDNDTAWSILSGAGYTIQDYGGQQWLHKDGVPVRPPDGPNGGYIDFLYSTGAEVYPQGPGGGMVRNWNRFIQFNTTGTKTVAEGPLMQINPTDFTSLVVDLLAIHDYDIIGIGLTNLGRYVDWIYDCFHSDNDQTWGWNFVGIHDDDFDTWSEIILTDMDANRIQEACENFTSKFVNELMPWFPAITGLEFCTTKRGPGIELTNVISMENYGPRNDWSWACMHWNGTPGVAWPGGSYKTALGDEPDTMNPWTDDTLYGWQFMDRAMSGLLALNPTTLKNMPYIATNWILQNWTSIPELGIENGSYAQFWIRQDVKWQDHKATDPHYVDAYDCVANMRFMREYQPGRYSSTWAHLVYSEADGPYKFNTYFDQTSLYYADYVAGTSLMVPEEIIEVVEGYWQTWAPCDNTTKYAGLGLGAPPAAYPYMTQLVGCGPFVFRNYDRSLAVGSVGAFNEYFVSDPVIGSVYGEWRINPGDNYTYQPLIQNVAAKAYDADGTVTSATVDVEIFEDGVSVHNITGETLIGWEHKYLGPYTITNVTGRFVGPNPIPHTITVVITGDAFTHTYTHEYVATIRQDVNTYTGELLDFTVDMRDVGRAARAFGSYPGHLRWDPACDINDDFTVDMRDIGGIARYFGWKVS